MINNQQPLPNRSQIKRQFSRPAKLTCGAEPELLKEGQTGLIKTPKRLSSQFLGDVEGGRIFQEIMHLPEYYLTRSAYEILTNHKIDLVDLFTVGTSKIDLIELGAGDGQKTRILLEQRFVFMYA